MRFRGWISITLSVFSVCAAVICATSFCHNAAWAQPVPAGFAPEKSLQDLLISKWTTGGELSTINNILYAEPGYIWISSYSGLYRFDGRTFKAVEKDVLPTRRTRGVTALAKDHAGTLWVGSQGDGLFFLRNGRFEHYGEEDPAHCDIASLFFDREGEVWVGGRDQGAWRYREGKAAPVDHPDLRQMTIAAIAQDSTGAIFFGTEGKGLVRLRDGRFSTLTTAEGLSGDRISSLHAVSDGLWIGTETGLDRLEGEELRSFPELGRIYVDEIHSDDYGNLWIVTKRGLIRKNAVSGRFERLDEFRGLSLKDLSGLLFDHEGGIWCSIYGGGELLQMRAGRFTNYTKSDGLATDEIGSIAEIEPGRFLVGAGIGTIHKIEGGEISTFRPSTPLPDAQIKHLHKDRRGNLWISSDAGLLRIHGEEETLYTMDHGLPSNAVRFTYEDRRGVFWVGTANGLARRRGESFESMAEGLASHLILSISEDAEGHVLVGAVGGLVSLNGDGEMTEWSSEQGLPGTVVFSTFTDSRGAVWICTNEGLSRLFGGVLKTLTESDGLPVNSVFDYKEDASGSAWLASSIGVVRIEKKQLDSFMDGQSRGVNAVVLNEEDGMVNRSCTGARKSLRAADGSLWFPTLGGVSVIDPGRVTFNTSKPPVILGRFAVDGAPIDAALLDGSEQIELEPGAKRYDFEFAALSYKTPAKVEVKYRLMGFDPEWVEAGAQRSVSYTTLPHGEYTFRVIAANSDGLWNEEGATLRFLVKPFFRETPRFLIFMALLLTSLLATLFGGIYTLRMRIIRRTDVERIRLIEELEAKNVEMGRFIYTVSHDLKSPLFTIQGFLGMLRSDIASRHEERIEHDLESIETAAGHMGRLLDELLELSRIGRGGNSPEEVPMGELAHHAVTMVAARIGEKNVRVVIAPDLPKVVVDRTRLLQVIQNLVDNAVKFIDQGDSINSEPTVEIGRREEGGQTVFFVRDNGPGIDPRYCDKVFDLFEQLSPSHEGTGIGLAIVKRVIEVHGGRIWAESEGNGEKARVFVSPWTELRRRMSDQGWAITNKAGARRKTQLRAVSRLSGSSAPKLSSKISNSLSWSNARAMKSRLFSPCESCQPLSPTI